MPRRVIVSLAALVALSATLACDAGLTAPPSGLAVELTRVNAPAPPTQFFGDADSVTVLLSSSLLTNNPCVASQLDAGVSGATLVITRTSRVTTSPCPVTAVMVLPTTRIVAHRVPSGSYAVVVAERVTLWNQPEAETVVARGQITVP